MNGVTFCYFKKNNDRDEYDLSVNLPRKLYSKTEVICNNIPKMVEMVFFLRHVINSDYSDFNL